MSTKNEQQHIRAKQVSFALNSFALEGFTPDEYLIKLSDKYIQGEIEIDEFTKISMEYINNGK